MPTGKSHERLVAPKRTRPKGRTRTPARESLAIPLLLAFSAPIAVIYSIESLHSVWWTFALYQVAICLCLPAIASRLEGRSWREHAAILGLRRSRAEEGYEPVSERSQRTWKDHHLLLSGTLGITTALVSGGFLVATRGRFLDSSRLTTTLAEWGVSPQRMLTMLAIMVVLTPAAEELFWRGYIPGCIASSRPGSRASIALTVILPAVLYTSYHAVTILRLLNVGSGALVMTAGVFGAGLFWGWLRRLTGSVWPPLASHAGAVIAYLAVYLWILQGSRS